MDDGEDVEVLATPTRRFTLLEITSGLPDDSREADERDEARHLHDLRGRVKTARAVVSSTSGLAEVLANDWRNAARFYARFGIAEPPYRTGLPARSDSSDVPDTSSPSALAAELISR